MCDCLSGSCQVAPELETSLFKQHSKDTRINALKGCCWCELLDCVKWRVNGLQCHMELVCSVSGSMHSRFTIQDYARQELIHWPYAPAVSGQTSAWAGASCAGSGFRLSWCCIKAECRREACSSTHTAAHITHQSVTRSQKWSLPEIPTDLN